MSSKLPHFTHQALDLDRPTIRLAQLQPRKRKRDPINVTLNHYDRANCPSYIALSYVWGPPNPVHTITINDKSFEVRENLFLFLCMYTKRISEETHFWIDQLCIDQTSNGERSHQVALMGDIYKNAEEVIAWLGPAAQGSGLLLWTLRRLGPKWNDHHFRTSKTLSSLAILRHSMTHPRLCMKVICLRPALRAVLRRSYWRRIWICQEFILARRLRIFCGPHECASEDLGGACFLHNMLVLALAKSTRDKLDLELIDARVLNSRWETDFTFYNTIYFYVRGECEDPRDKIFGLAGLIDAAQSPRIDYTVSAINVFAEALAIAHSIPPKPGEEARRASALYDLHAEFAQLTDCNGSNQLCADAVSFENRLRAEGFDGVLEILRPYLCPAGILRLKEIRASQQSQSCDHEA